MIYLKNLNFVKAVAVFQVKLAGDADSLKHYLVLVQIRTELVPEGSRQDFKSLQTAIKSLMSRLYSTLELFQRCRVTRSGVGHLFRFAFEGRIADSELPVWDLM